MSIKRFKRQFKLVISSALLVAGFVGCSGSGEEEVSADEPSADESSAPSAPNADESVAGIPFCNGCYPNFTACEFQISDPESCYCTTSTRCCGPDTSLAAMECEP